MKIKSGFIMREIAGEYIVVPTGRAAVDFNGIITVNETGMFIWNLLKEDSSEDELVDKLLEEFDIDRETACADVKEYLENMRAAKILED
ncbi:MAG: PqqD family protein [Lachnospiraceae bacterium]|nr:PqqD family protein [Lachnospiraceae bacterium]